MVIVHLVCRPAGRRARPGGLPPHRGPGRTGDGRGVPVCRRFGAGRRLLPDPVDHFPRALWWFPVSELTVGRRRPAVADLSLRLLGGGGLAPRPPAARVGPGRHPDGPLAAGLGGDYDRCRTDVGGGRGRAERAPAGLLRAPATRCTTSAPSRTTPAPRTTSDLLCPGVRWPGSSHSIYSGLIRIRKGAVRAVAMQTNNNLVLDESAHADSVPNLDIEENDVRCSHASTVGPIDDNQRWYLESRGVPPDRGRAPHRGRLLRRHRRSRCPVPAARALG